MITDPISDMFTRIRNAYLVEKASVVVSASKAKEAVLNILKENGYIENFKKDGTSYQVDLCYQDGRPAITSIERVSKPGRRMYVKKDEIPVVLSGQGIAIISTPKGVMTGEAAKSKGFGGELIAKVY